MSMTSNQARFFFRILAVPVAALFWLGAVLFALQAITHGDFKQAVVSLHVCLLALLFTFVICKDQAPRWLHHIFTWGQRP
ncbi:MAG: hypothetical protein DMD96_35075 [Candidatus Rokuibacteriota bacterium]|nr:MAG: hypothetical protein DMD96_35075 [Candidatus Rokubacteria bacterium]